MTTKAEREILLQGKDEVANLAMATLAERGWAIDCRLKNVATRTYGPNGASIRIELDSEFERYWLHAHYWTEGSNILEAITGSLLSLQTSFDDIAAPPVRKRDDEIAVDAGEICQ